MMCEKAMEAMREVLAAERRGEFKPWVRAMRKWLAYRPGWPGRPEAIYVGKEFFRILNDVVKENVDFLGADVEQTDDPGLKFCSIPVVPCDDRFLPIAEEVAEVAGGFAVIGGCHC